LEVGHNRMFFPLATISKETNVINKMEKGKEHENKHWGNYLIADLS
jgi:hypothetical protein